MTINPGPRVLTPAQRDKLVDKFVEDLLEIKLRTRALQRYKGGDIPNYYRDSLSPPDYLYVDETSMRFVQWLQDNCTPDFREHIGGKLKGVDPGCYFQKGCRREFEIPKVGKVTVDFWRLRWYLDES